VFIRTWAEPLFALGSVGRASDWGIISQVNTTALSKKEIIAGGVLAQSVMVVQAGTTELSTNLPYCRLAQLLPGLQVNTAGIPSSSVVRVGSVGMRLIVGTAGLLFNQYIRSFSCVYIEVKSQYRSSITSSQSR
jgi:hypothetical protein